MTVALGKVKGRCKLRDSRYSRGLRTRIVAIVKFMGGFFVCLFNLSSLSYQQRSLHSNSSH